MAIVNVQGQTGGGKRFIIGSLTGNGTNTQTISDLAFEPKNISIVLAQSTAATVVCEAYLIGGYKSCNWTNGMKTPNGTFSYNAGVLSVYSGNSGIFFENAKQYNYILTE